WVDGMELTAMSDAERVRFRREKVGIIFQQFHLLPYLDALENVMVAQHYHSVADADEARAALERRAAARVRGARAGQSPATRPGRRADRKPGPGERRQGVDLAARAPRR